MKNERKGNNEAMLKRWNNYFKKQTFLGRNKLRQTGRKTKCKGKYSSWGEEEEKLQKKNTNKGKMKMKGIGNYRRWRKKKKKNK